MNTAFQKSILASAVGISLAATFVGGNLALSHIAIPSLLLGSPKSSSQLQLNQSSKPVTNSGHLARQWQKVYNIGVVVGPSIAVLASASFYAAYHFLPKAAVPQGRLLIASIILALMIGPYTNFIMLSTNNELHRRANEVVSDTNENSGKAATKIGSLQSYETSDLIESWGRMNTGRAMLQVASITCAITALAL